MGEIYQIFEKSRFTYFWDDLGARIGISMKDNAQNMGSYHDLDDFQFVLNLFLTSHPISLTHLSAG